MNSSSATVSQAAPLTGGRQMVSTRVEADAFPRTSIAAMALLTLATATAYMPYWLYTRTRTLNSVARARIPGGLVIGAIVLYALAFLAALGQAFVPYDDPMRLVLLFLALSANSSLIVWVLLFRARLSEDVLHRPTGAPLNLMLTIMLSIFYMQQKINAAQDAD